MSPTVTMAAMLVLTLAASPASARPRHHRHPGGSHVAIASQPTAAQSEPFSFYPNDIEGGVPGNLPFNNQIRKMTDPLNANGAGS